MKFLLPDKDFEYVDDDEINSDDVSIGGFAADSDLSDSDVEDAAFNREFEEQLENLLEECDNDTDADDDNINEDDDFDLDSSFSDENDDNNEKNVDDNKKLDNAEASCSKSETNDEGDGGPSGKSTIDSDADADSSDESVDMTLQDIFDTDPNVEEDRNHPISHEMDAPVQDVCFHSEVDILAVACIEGSTAILNFTRTEVEEVSRLQHHSSSVRLVYFSSDGDKLYTASRDKSWAIIDTQTTKVSSHFKDAHKSPIYSLLEITENQIATGDDDGVIKLWDARQKKSTKEYNLSKETVTSLLTDIKSNLLSATMGDGSLYFINYRSGKKVSESDYYNSEFLSQCLLRNQKHLVVSSGDGPLYMFNWGDAEQLNNKLLGHTEAVLCQAPITNDVILTGCDDGKIRVIEVFPRFKYLGVVGSHEEGGVDRMAVSVEGDFVASCNMDPEIRFWDISYLYLETIGERSKKKDSHKTNLDVNLRSSRMRNKSDFFWDIPDKMAEGEEEAAAPAPVPHVPYDPDDHLL